MTDVRTFTSPSGRQWSVAEFTAPSTGGSPPLAVLRFTAADLVLDLEGFPADWSSYSDEELMKLARAAQPPKIGIPAPPSPGATRRTNA